MLETAVLMNSSTGIGPTLLAEHKHRVLTADPQNGGGLMEAEQEVLIHAVVCFGSFSLKGIRLTLRP